MSGKTLAGARIVESFEEATTLLKKFLTEHGRPSRLVWVKPDDVVGFWSRTFVRVPLDLSDDPARIQFEQARANGQAIGLNVQGHSSDRSFVVLELAEDQRDAELKMMSNEHAKLSIPESSLPPMREVFTGTMWAMLRLMAAS